MLSHNIFGEVNKILDLPTALDPNQKYILGPSIADKQTNQPINK